MSSQTKTGVSRRDVFRAGGLAAAAALAGGTAAGTAEAAVDYSIVPVEYERLGVRPFISLTATLTINGGALTVPEVKKAAEMASHYPVNLDHLMDKVGARIAKLLGAEAAIVTSGAAAALTHATAACIAGTDPELIQQLPDLRGLKDEVVIPRQSRNVYDHAFRAMGVRMVQVETPEEFHAALGPRTALVAVLGTGEARGRIRLEEIAEAAHKRGIPVVVDAAAELPGNPNPYLSRGADLVAYSGGKVIRGPQCAGLLLGRKDLVHAAWINSSPHHSFGRMMKVGKEEIMGMLAAVEVLAAKGIEPYFQMWTGWLQEIAAAATSVRGVGAEMVGPQGASPYPTLNIEWEPEQVGITGGQLYDLLLNGNPSIMSHASGDSFSFRIRPIAMREGDSRIVAGRLQEIFSKAPKGVPEKKLQPAAADISGRWEVDVQFEVGSSRHTLLLRADGNRVEGAHLGRRLRGDLRGEVDGNRVRMRSGFPYEGTTLGYRFEGTIQGDGMSGTLDCGEWGEARWSATRA